MVFPSILADSYFRARRSTEAADVARPLDRRVVEHGRRPAGPSAPTRTRRCERPDRDFLEARPPAGQYQMNSGRVGIGRRSKSPSPAARRLQFASAASIAMAAKQVPPIQTRRETSALDKA